MRVSMVLVLTSTLALLATSAHAQTVTLTFTGSIGSVSGELVGTVSASDVFSGSITYDASTAGIFTPSPNPMFVRGQMIYPGAITSVALTLVGDTVTGTAGDVTAFDAQAMLAGSDALETSSIPDTGTIGGYAVSRLAVNPEYDYMTFSLTASSPIPLPLPYASTVFNYVSLSTSGGGVASGSLDSLVVSSGNPPGVPLADPWAILSLTGVLAAMGTHFVLGMRRAEDR